MAEERLEEIRETRLARREALLSSGQIPYPSEVRRTHTIREALAQFESLKEDDTPVPILGRVTSLRRHGGVVFCDVRDEHASIQIQFNRDDLDSTIFEKIDLLDSGDFVEVSGVLTLTSRGVKTLLVSVFHIVSKSIRPLPASWFGLKDQETRYRQREVDFLLNDSSRKVFYTRSKIITWLRSYFTEHNYLEVETPILQAIPGGTMAKPFHTHHNALDIPLSLRIAPEIYLKRLVVGGFEQVFEIGRNFRNEGIDREHNPEFTMLESYSAYQDYEDLMDLTDEIFNGLAMHIFGSSDVTLGDTVLSFRKPIARRRYIDVVSEVTGFNILDEKDPAKYLEIFEARGLALPEIQSYEKLVDELYKEVVRPHIIQPTILYDYPVEMVPLAKQNATDPRVAEMFQLVLGGMEVLKAYTELNDPIEQRARFEAQMQAREAGDDEAQLIDEAYLRAMEYGMPPVAGFGLGVDRLVSIFTDTDNLRDTIAFPLLKPE